MGAIHLGSRFPLSFIDNEPMYKIMLENFELFCTARNSLWFLEANQKLFSRFREIIRERRWIMGSGYISCRRDYEGADRKLFLPERIERTAKIINQLAPTDFFVCNEIFDNTENGFRRSTDKFYSNQYGDDWLIDTFREFKRLLLPSIRLGINEYGLRNRGLWESVINYSETLAREKLLDFVGFQYYHDFTVPWHHPKSLVPKRHFTIVSAPTIRRTVTALSALGIEVICSEMAVTKHPFQRKLYDHLLELLPSMGVNTVLLWSPINNDQSKNIKGGEWHFLGKPTGSGYLDLIQTFPGNHCTNN